MRGAAGSKLVPSGPSAARQEREPRGEAAASHFVHAGQLYVAARPESIILILGSSAGVCVWDPVSGIGGATQFLLPAWGRRGTASLHYGNVAVPALLDKLVESGASRRQLRARVFGGGCLLESMPGAGLRRVWVGTRNVQLALDALAKEHVHVVSAKVGSDRGQRVEFLSHTGETFVKTL